MLTPPRRGDSLAILAVEQVEAAGKGGEAGNVGAIGEEQERRTVRIFLAPRNPDRLIYGVAILRRAVRQPAVGLVGP